MRCWSDKIYLSPLAHRFWKLTLQLYSRYAKFLDEVSLTTPEDCSHLKTYAVDCQCRRGLLVFLTTLRVHTGVDEDSVP